MLIAGLARFQHRLLSRNLTGLKNLCPAIGEPAIAQHHGFFATGELPGNRFHGKGSAAGHNDRRFGVVNLFQPG